jgi:hypothetical protein
MMLSMVYLANAVHDSHADEHPSEDHSTHRSPKPAVAASGAK